MHQVFWYPYHYNIDKMKFIIPLPYQKDQPPIPERVRFLHSSVESELVWVFGLQKERDNKASIHVYIYNILTYPLTTLHSFLLISEIAHVLSYEYSSGHYQQTAVRKGSGHDVRVTQKGGGRQLHHSYSIIQTAGNVPENIQENCIQKVCRFLLTSQSVFMGWEAS